MQDNKECCLCSQIAGHRENDLISRLLCEDRYIRRVPMETEHFAAIPSLGPLVPGHTLLCPKDHIKNMACVSPLDTDELDSFRRRLSGALGTIFHAPVHLFEHGSSPRSSRVLCTVDHAHLHLVPTNIRVLNHLLRDSHWGRIEPALYGLRRSAPQGEYLYYESPEGDAFLAERRTFESQYIRRLFAEALGLGAAWNWREHPQADEVDATFRALSAVS